MHTIPRAALINSAYAVLLKVCSKKLYSVETSEDAMLFMLDVAATQKVFVTMGMANIVAWHRRVLAMGILYVRLSVRPSRPGTDSMPGEIETPGLHHMIA